MSSYVFEVHDGHTAFFWVDDWLQVGKLIDITGPIGTCHLRIDRHARVRDAAGNSSWNIRGHRSRYFQELIDRIQTVQLPHETLGHDVALWKHSDDNYKPYFSASSTWEQVRDKKPVVFWRKVVWFPQGVPRFSFILWLAVKNRLSTGDRMRVWGIQQGCVLCGERDETRDHLFFACPYSFTVWDKLVNRLTGNGTDPDWMGTLRHVSDNSLPLFDRILLKMAFQTCVYLLWKERNGRRHHTCLRTVYQLIRIIDKTVRNRITSLRYKAGHKLEGLMRRWFEVTA